MKTIHFVPPALVLIIAAAWLANLRDSNRALEQKNNLLQQKITVARTSSASQNEQPKVIVKKEKNSSQDEGPASTEWVSTSRDWQRLALFINDEEDSRTGEAKSKLKQILSQMSGDELARACRELASLSISTEYFNDLEAIMLRDLVKKKPEFAFSQLITRLERNDRDFAIAYEFSGWIARDAAAAIAWYEKEVASGVFDKTLDGSSPAMFPFEAALMRNIASSDFKVALSRMDKIPPNQREKFFLKYLKYPEGKEIQPVAEMARRTMTQKEYMNYFRGAFVDPYTTTTNKDAGLLKKNIDTIKATPEERASLVQMEIERYRKYSVKFIDTFRKLAQAISPTSADQSTGSVLVEMLKSNGTAEEHDRAAKIVMEYHEAGASDDLLLPLIQSSAKGTTTFPKEKARELAMRISDQTLRGQLLQDLE